MLTVDRRIAIGCDFLVSFVRLRAPGDLMHYVTILGHNEHKGMHEGHEVSYQMI